MHQRVVLPFRGMSGGRIIGMAEASEVLQGTKGKVLQLEGNISIMHWKILGKAQGLLVVGAGHEPSVCSGG